MKASAVLSLLGALPACFAAPAAEAETQDLEARQRDCVVNRQVVETWHEHSKTRRRIHVTAHNTKPDAYCHYWSNAPAGNRQCYIREGRGHVIDYSSDLGAWGDQVFWNEYKATMDDWIKDTRCRTG